MRSEKTTQSEQALLSGNRRPTHEVTNRDCHIPLTTHFFMMHTLFLMAKICLLQVLALDDVTHVMFHDKLIQSLFTSAKL